jgi:hypothetical protein
MTTIPAFAEGILWWWGSGRTKPFPDLTAAVSGCDSWFRTLSKLWWRVGFGGLDSGGDSGPILLRYSSLRQYNYVLSKMVLLLFLISCSTHGKDGKCLQNFGSKTWKEVSRDSSVGIALGYGLDDRGCRIRFSAGAGNFSLHHRVQNGSGAHPAYPVVTRGSFPGGKAVGAWSWPLTSI